MKKLIYIIIVLFVISCANTNKEKVVEVEQSTTEMTKTEIDTTLTESKIVQDTIAKTIEDKNKREPYPSPLPPPPPELEIIEDDEFEFEEEIAMPDLEFRKYNRMHEGWNNILKRHVSSTGKVDYSGFKRDYKELISYTFVLMTNAPKSNWTKDEKKAYWMNVYNAYTIKLIVENYPLKSITDLDKPWDNKIIKIDGKSYSLSDVENNILRKMNDARIHFGINCASISCPKLANYAFTEKNVNSKLELLTKGFMKDVTKNKLSADAIEVSKLFEWYKDDFIVGGTVLDYINKYSKVKVNADAKITYKEYDWNLND